MVKWDSSLTGKTITATVVVLSSNLNYLRKALAQLEEQQFAKLRDAGSSPCTPLFFIKFKA